MRLSKIAFAAIFGSTSLVLSPALSAAEYNVDINKTSILHLPAAASAVLVGNPEIADVSVHSVDTLFLVGRSYGETNLIVLDQAGQTIMNADVRVSHTTPSTGVLIHKVGEGRESYTCNPFCLPSPVLGDSDGFRGSFQATGAAITNTTVTGPPTSSTPFGAPPGFQPQFGASIDARPVFREEY